MTAKRVIIEFGTGNDLHGGDYTKAAIRAVEDALHHSSLTMLRNLKVDPKKMQVQVTIGAQQPEQVDCAQVAAKLPIGQITVKAVKIKNRASDIATHFDFATSILQDVRNQGGGG